MKIWSIKPLLRSTDSYIAAMSTARYLEGKKRVLVVGDAGGRDWEYLKRIGKDIYVLDIASQENIPNVFVQSIETRTPFEDGFFDGAVMNEVLEHLFHDVTALEEIYRVLSDDGVLVVTVPYISNVQDQPEYHVRVHTQKTIRRLLERCGFEVEDHFCRGFCTRLPQFNVVSRSLIYALHKLAEIFTRKTPDEAVDVVNSFLEKIEMFLGKHSVTIRFQKLFASYGGIMKARRVKEKKNFDEVQIANFMR